MKKLVKVRLAENSEGAAVKALHEESEAGDDDFGNIFPFWLVAEHRGQIVGCIQTCPSLPFARLEMLHVKQSLPDQLKALVTRELLMTGLVLMRQQGATKVFGFVPFEEKGYKRTLKNRGAVVVDSGNMLMRRVA